VPFHHDREYLHGGPAQLEGGRLRRYGRSRHDAGALFFAENTREGRLYAARYAFALQVPPAVWRVRIHLTTSQVFDFARGDHRYRLAHVMSPYAWQSISASAYETGQLDWAYVDEEQMREADFLGALLLERSAGHLGRRAVYSVAVFDAANVEIVGRLDDATMAGLARALAAIDRRGPRP